MGEKTKKTRKPYKRKEPKMTVRYLNRPSEEAIRNFRLAFYEIVVDMMEKEYGHR